MSNDTLLALHVFSIEKMRCRVLHFASVMQDDSGLDPSALHIHSSTELSPVLLNIESYTMHAGISPVFSSSLNTIALHPFIEVWIADLFVRLVPFELEMPSFNSS